MYISVQFLSETFRRILKRFETLLSQAGQNKVTKTRNAAVSTFHYTSDCGDNGWSIYMWSRFLIHVRRENYLIIVV